ncbi:MAG: DUF11 domain-containing protein, partial [Cytophagaceae bacterium]
MKKKLLLLFFFLVSVSALPQANIVVTNTDNTNYYSPGNNSHVYTVSVTNLGPDPATNVVVTNAVPAGINYFSWVGSNGSSGTATTLTPQLNNTIPTLAAGQTVTYLITIEIPAGLLIPLVSTANVTANAPAVVNCAACTDTDVKAVGADLSVINTDNQSQYVPGSTVVYTLTVKNNGPLLASTVQVDNPIPAGITQFSWVGNGASGTNVPLLNTISSIAVGQSVVYTITVQVPPTYTGNLVNAASVTSLSTDPTPACPTCTDTDTQGFGADLEITNTNNQLNYVSGTTTTYTVTVTNNGPGTATDVHVTNAIPAGIPAASFTWAGSNGSGASGTALDNTLPTLAAGATVTYTVTVNIPAAFTAPLTSQTQVTSTSTDPTPACANCTDTDTRTFGADIVVTNTDNNATYVPGTNAIYTLTVNNLGPEDATNVQVVNNIPAGITAFSWVGSNGTTGTNQNLNDTIATLLAGTSVTYTITLGVPAGATLPITSTAFVTTPTPDPNPGCADCTDTDTLAAGGADLVIAHSDNVSAFTPGSTTTYTISVTNNGPAVANNVVIANNAPAGVPVGNVSWTGTSGSGTGNLNEGFATLAVGQTVTYQVTVNVPSDYDPDTNLVNTVSVTSDTTDPNPTCATCVDTDLPMPMADL